MRDSEILKDHPYVFDFLSIDEEAHERDLERELVKHIHRLEGGILLLGTFLGTFLKS